MQAKCAARYYPSDLGTSVANFTEGLGRRIRSMSRAHSLLTQSRWEGASIKQLIGDGLAAYKARHENFALNGPPLSLKPNTALALSLAIHELATNAAKYGALSVGTGYVDVSRPIDGSGGVDLH